MEPSRSIAFASLRPRHWLDTVQARELQRAGNVRCIHAALPLPELYIDESTVGNAAFLKKTFVESDEEA